MTEAENRALAKAQQTVRLLSDKIHDYEKVCPRPWTFRFIDWLLRVLHA